MQTKINERKNSLLSLKPTLKVEHSGLERRISKLKILVIVHVMLVLFLGGVLVVSIVSEIFELDVVKWDKLGLPAILSLSVVLSLPNEWYEFKLLKHLKVINAKLDFKGLETLNIELKHFIEKINNRWKYSWLEFIIAIVMLFMGIWQMLEKNNPYWNYIKIPLLVFYGLIIVKFIIMNRKLNENIKETEKYCN